MYIHTYIFTRLNNLHISGTKRCESKDFMIIFVYNVIGQFLACVYLRIYKYLIMCESMCKVFTYKYIIKYEYIQTSRWAYFKFIICLYFPRFLPLKGNCAIYREFLSFCINATSICICRCTCMYVYVRDNEL